MKYKDWLADFIISKKEVATFDLNDKFAIHSIIRYATSDQRPATERNLWETAITYTGRLVTRQGSIQDDGLTVKWEDWITQHDVEIPKTRV